MQLSNTVRVSGGYLAVVKLSGCAVGISPEESREQTEGGRRGRHLCLQGALWFGGQAASAALQAICAHHCEEENDRRQKEKVSLLVDIGAASFLTFYFPTYQLDITVHPLQALSNTGSYKPADGSGAALQAPRPVRCVGLFAYMWFVNVGGGITGHVRQVRNLREIRAK